jgi:hypothetical protein
MPRLGARCERHPHVRDEIVCRRSDLAAALDPRQAATGRKSEMLYEWAWKAKYSNKSVRYCMSLIKTKMEL